MANHTKRTPEKEKNFLLALSLCGNVSQACRESNVPRATAYEWKEEDAEFAAAWDRARIIGAEALEDEARRRAHDGVDRPIYQGGKMVGTVRDYSDTLLIFLLKGAMPERYRENSRIEHLGSMGVSLIHSIPRPPKEAK